MALFLFIRNLVPPASDGAGYKRTEIRTCDGACYRLTDRQAPGRFAPGPKTYQSGGKVKVHELQYEIS